MDVMYLYGASGHGKVIAEIAELQDIRIEAFIDQDVSKTKVLEYKVIHEKPSGAIDIIISIGNNETRKEIVNMHSDFQYTILIHPSAKLSKRLNIGEGTVIMAGVTINSDSQVGKHCIINTNASIDHDCLLEDYVHISPNAALAGGVRVGEGSHIGIGACIIQGVTIGKWCTVGAGTVILKDIPDGATVVGNPGVIIKTKPDKL